MPTLPSTRSTTGTQPAVAGPTRPIAAVQPASIGKLPLDRQVGLLGDQVNDLRQRLGLAEQQISELWRQVDAMGLLIENVICGRIETDVVRQQSGGMLVLPNDGRLRVAIGNVALTIDRSVVNIDGAATVRVQGSAVQVQATTIDLTASVVKLNASQVRANGVVQCDTVVANTVVGASYSPGAGNVW